MFSSFRKGKPKKEAKADSEAQLKEQIQQLQGQAHEQVPKTKQVGFYFVLRVLRV
jgi:hypothetical protein